MRDEECAQNFSRKNLKGRGHSEDLVRRWEDNTRMALREIRWEDVCWILLAQDKGQWRAFENTVINHTVQ
jgi:hypothetical protein